MRRWRQPSPLEGDHDETAEEGGSDEFEMERDRGQRCSLSSVYNYDTLCESTPRNRVRLFVSKR